LLLLLLISSLRLQILGSIQIVFLCFFFPFQVSDLLPPSDLAPMEVRLLHLKRNISRSLPNTRLESKTDSLAYNRASGHLVEFKRALTDQVKKHSLQLCLLSLPLSKITFEATWLHEPNKSAFSIDFIFVNFATFVN
jgi:hypothetical protein